MSTKGISEHDAPKNIKAAQCGRAGRLPSTWLNGVMVRRHTNVAAVALANKNARIIWALLAHGCEFRSDAPPSNYRGVVGPVNFDNAD